MSKLSAEEEIYKKKYEKYQRKILNLIGAGTPEEDAAALKSATEKNTLLEEQLAKFNANLAAKETQLKEWEAQKSAWDSERSTWESEKSGWEKERKDWGIKNVEWESKEAAYKADKERFDIEKTSFQNQIAEQKSTFDAFVTKEKEATNELSKKIKESDERLAVVTKENETLKSSLPALEAQIAEKTAAIQKLENTVMEVTSQKNAISDKHNEDQVAINYYTFEERNRSDSIKLYDALKATINDFPDSKEKDLLLGAIRELKGNSEGLIKLIKQTKSMLNYDINALLTAHKEKKLHYQKKYETLSPEEEMYKKKYEKYQRKIDNLLASRR